MSQNRRQFLTETSQLAAGSILGIAALDELSSQAALLNRVSENEKINVALIGVGGRGNYLLKLINQHNDVVVTTLCDVNRQNLGRTAEKLNKNRDKKVKQVHDFRKVLDDDSIDAVVVATQHHWHAPIAVRALDANKHVYVEKPASHVLREGQLLMAAAKRNKRVVQHGTQMRSSEVTAAAGKVLASGILGEIKQSNLKE
ncbi:MAG: Gfo/Idh/MocA family oxidoreductase [Planctomycetes bacterium]|nr:Gfo/Idh/MocA family oxidoreductase [Planctomycetota bacterium]